MTTLTFDTLKFAQRLREAGIDTKHAEAEASALAEVLTEMTHSQELATKADVTAAVESAKADIIKWVAVMLIGQAGVIAALVKMF